MAKLSQNQRVLNHLIDHGYITQIIASSYGVRRLASRITDLKNVELNIDVQIRLDDAGVRYAFYSMNDEERAAEHVSRANGLKWNQFPVSEVA